MWLLTTTQGATGDYNHEARPSSAVVMADSLDKLGVTSIFWVGCGHAPEALLWIMRRAMAGDAVKVYGVERTAQSVDRAHQLLRLMYMVLYEPVTVVSVEDRVSCRRTDG